MCPLDREEDLDHRAIKMVTPGGERVQVVFSVVEDYMSENEDVSCGGKELRKVTKTVFQERSHDKRMSMLQGRWNRLCGLIKRLRENSANMNNQMESKVQYHRARMSDVKRAGDGEC